MQALWIVIIPLLGLYYCGKLLGRLAELRRWQRYGLYKKKEV
jgi:hypothetical protein